MAARSRRTHPSPAAVEVSLVDGLAQLSFLVHGLLARRADERDLSMIQTRLLGVLRDRRPSVNELAHVLALDKSSVSGLVDRAERRGLVRREPSAVDKRVVLVTLTDPGRSAASDVADRFAADVVALVDGWSVSDRQAMSGLVSRLLVDHARERGIDLFDTDTDTDTVTVTPGPARY